MALAILVPGCDRPGISITNPGGGVAAATAVDAAPTAGLERPAPLPSDALVQRFVRAGTAVEMALLPVSPSDDRPSGIRARGSCDLSLPAH